MFFFVYFKNTAFHKTLTDGLEGCGLWCFYQLFGLSFWRHPFTSEDPLVSKSWNATFLQICSDEETNSSRTWMSWRWIHFGWIMANIINTKLNWQIFDDYDKCTSQRYFIDEHQWDFRFQLTTNKWYWDVLIYLINIYIRVIMLQAKRCLYILRTLFHISTTPFGWFGPNSCML